jgi:nitrile hydratase
MTDAPKAIEELGYLGVATGHLHVVENTPAVHNLVVCTLCSCYPFSILGMAPNWYKTAAYRSRAVRDPRGVLAEFGVEIGNDVEVRVWDSTAELRYLVLPQRPDGTDAMDEDALAALVTRNSMIGTDRDLAPAAKGNR